MDMLGFALRARAVLGRQVDLRRRDREPLHLILLGRDGEAERLRRRTGAL